MRFLYSSFLEHTTSARISCCSLQLAGRLIGPFSNLLNQWSRSDVTALQNPKVLWCHTPAGHSHGRATLYQAIQLINFCHDRQGAADVRARTLTVWSIGRLIRQTERKRKREMMRGQKKRRTKGQNKWDQDKLGYTRGTKKFCWTFLCLSQICCNCVALTAVKLMWSH